MANGTTPDLTPATGGLNYADYERQIQEAAAKTRSVAQPSSYEWSKLSGAAKKIWKPANVSGYRRLGQALVGQGKREALGMQAQAEKAAGALEMVGTSTLAGMKNLESIQAQVKTQVTSATDAWNSAAEKADEYVKSARGRVGEVLTKLDEIHSKIGKDRDFAKAHAMQASVQAVMGSMKDEERNIAETYGTGSKEFAQFRQSKQTTLATVQSNIHANYEQVTEQANQTYLNAVNDAYTKSNMYVGFQEQQHVDMLKFRDEQRNAYALQASQLDVGIEQLKMAGMENLANWIVETPTFSYDITPLAMSISELSSTASAEQQAWQQLRIAKKAGKTDWGAIAATAGGTALGAAVGGPVGGAIGARLGSALTKKGAPSG